MKKLLLTLFCFINLCAIGEPLRGGVIEEYIPDGFFGSWGVISKIKDSNNPMMFNTQSRDVWMLSGYSNILILENLESGAKSEITIKEKSLDNKTLKFERQKIIEKSGIKTIYKEIVSFILDGNNFKGTDNFIVEKYKNNKLLEKNYANYTISGVRISGKSPN
ncbi:MAG: hypothetical protein IJ003_04200 [Candidatus Gastranaerophilales bacterium]|nr:hypothetical protein [Candidatus Gastranaerophilales bacterium]